MKRNGELCAAKLWKPGAARFKETNPSCEHDRSVRIGSDHTQGGKINRYSIYSDRSRGVIYGDYTKERTGARSSGVVFAVNETQPCTPINERDRTRAYRVCKCQNAAKIGKP